MKSSPHLNTVLGAMAAFGLVACQGDAAPDDTSAAPQGAAMDLSGYELVFDEPFDTLDISAWDCDTKWIAHTPYAGDFGDAIFTDPSETFPFTTKDGILRIEAKRDNTGQWRSGIISSQNPCYNGFAQKYGYFEARMKLPGEEGVWPAFWMLSHSEEGYWAELDPIEYYGHMPDRFQSGYIMHQKTSERTSYFDKTYKEGPPNFVENSFNTFGISVEPDEIVYYFNREPYWRFPTPEEFHEPMYVMANLGMGSGWNTENTPDPSYMYVDYIRVWAKKPDKD